MKCPKTPCYVMLQQRVNLQRGGEVKKWRMTVCKLTDRTKTIGARAAGGPGQGRRGEGSGGGKGRRGRRGGKRMR